MVVLDVVFVTPELLQWTLQFSLGLTQAGNQDSSYTSTQFIRMQYQEAPAEKRALAQAIPLLQPDLAAAGRAQMFQSQIDAQDTALRNAVPDPAVRRQQAIDRVADSYAAVYPGYQCVQLLAATQPPAQTEAMVQAIGTSAALGAAVALGAAPPSTVADAASLYLHISAVNADLPATTLVHTLKTDLTVRDLLSKTPAEAIARLDRARVYQRFVAAYTAQTKTIVEQVNTAA